MSATIGRLMDVVHLAVFCWLPAPCGLLVDRPLGLTLLVMAICIGASRGGGGCKLLRALLSQVCWPGDPRKFAGLAARTVEGSTSVKTQ